MDIEADQGYFIVVQNRPKIFACTILLYKTDQLLYWILELGSQQFEAGQRI